MPSPSTTNSFRLGLSHIFIFTFAVAFVYAAQTAIAIRVSRETYQQFVTNLKPQMAALAVLDAMAKGLALCGVVVFAVRRLTGSQPQTHAAEYLWLLLGLAVLVSFVSRFIPYTWVGGVYLIGGGLGAWLMHETRWKLFYLAFALSPFIIFVWVLAGLFVTPTGVSFCLAMKEVLISSVLTICLIGTHPHGGCLGSSCITVQLYGHRYFGLLADVFRSLAIDPLQPQGASRGLRRD